MEIGEAYGLAAGTPGSWGAVENACQGGAAVGARALLVKGPVGEGVPVAGDEGLVTVCAGSGAALFVVDVAGVGVVDAIRVGDPAGA